MPLKIILGKRFFFWQSASPGHEQTVAEVCKENQEKTRAILAASRGKTPEIAISRFFPVTSEIPQQEVLPLPQPASEAEFEARI